MTKTDEFIPETLRLNHEREWPDEREPGVSTITLGMTFHGEYTYKDVHIGEYPNREYARRSAGFLYGKELNWRETSVPGIHEERAWIVTDKKEVWTRWVDEAPKRRMRIKRS